MLFNHLNLSKPRKSMAKETGVYRSGRLWGDAWSTCVVHDDASGVW